MWQAQLIIFFLYNKFMSKNWEGDYIGIKIVTWGASQRKTLQQLTLVNYINNHIMDYNNTSKSCFCENSIFAITYKF